MVFGAFLKVIRRFIKIKRRRLVGRSVKSRRKKKLKKHVRRQVRKKLRKISRRGNPAKKTRKRKASLKRKKKIQIRRKKRTAIKVKKRIKEKQQQRVSKKKVSRQTVKQKKVEAPLLGEITHYFPKVRAAVVTCKKQISIGDAIRIKGSSTDFRQTVGSLQIDRSPIISAKKGQEVGLEVMRDVRPGDKVYASL